MELPGIHFQILKRSFTFYRKLTIYIFFKMHVIVNAFLFCFLREKIHGSTFMSQAEYARIGVKQPEPGKWFAIAFKSYQDPKDDKVTQKGLSKQCETYGFGNITWKNANPAFIALDKSYEENFTNNSFRLFKFYNPTNSYRGELFLSSNHTTGIHIQVSTWSKSIPDITKDSKLSLVKSLTSLPFLILPKTFNYLYLQVNSTKEAHSDISLKVSLPVQSEISGEYNFPLLRKSFGGLSSFDYSSLNTLRKFTLIQGRPVRVTFRIEDLVDTGGTLTIRITKESTVLELCKSQLLICLTRGIPSSPVNEEACVIGSTRISVPIIPKDKNLIHVPYPESGQWFLSIDSFCRSEGRNFTNISEIYNLWVFSSHCVVGGCSDNNGQCAISEDSGIVYTFCYCVRGYKGWDCSNDSNLQSNISPLFATLLLTLSNLFFVPSVVICLIRRLYTEAIVYFFGMLFSITYHACDEQELRSEFCNSYIDLLQFADFYCNLLGIWITPVAMAKLSTPCRSICHIMGAIFIAFGTLWDKHSYFLTVLPTAFGLLLILYSWIYRCCKYRRLFPSKRYLTIYVPIGASLVSFALICYTVLQTKRDYHIIHSVWHMLMALSLLFLLPGKTSLEENFN